MEGDDARLLSKGAITIRILDSGLAALEESVFVWMASQR
jgi:hypothetical protein